MTAQADQPCDPLLCIRAQPTQPQSQGTPYNPGVTYYDPSGRPMPTPVLRDARNPGSAPMSAFDPSWLSPLASAEITRQQSTPRLPNQRSLVRSCEHYLNLETIMTEDTTTSEQLAEIEGQPQPVQVREGRWRTRHGDIRNVTPTPAHDSRAKRWPWRDAKYDQTWREDGGHHIIGESPSDLVEYLGPIEPQPQPQPEAVPQPQLQPDGLVRDVTHLLQESGVLDLAKAEQQIEELRSEVSYVQNLLGESRRRVTHLESLVANLRTINAAQEKAVDAAGKENTALRNQLAVAKEELTIAAAVSHQLQIELDAAQQVPVDSPDL